MATAKTLITHQDVLDVLIVGGGLAGLGGALMLSRARRSVVVLDAGNPRNAPAAHTHGYLTRDGFPPLEMLRLGREEIRTYGNQIVPGEVVSIDKNDAGLYVARLENGTTYQARRLLFTTGLVDELPDVPGLAERWGRDVVHCPYCFGWEIRDEPMAILGGAAHSVGQALMWRQWTDDLTLVTPDSSAISSTEHEQLSARGIRVVEGDIESLAIDANDDLSGVILSGGTTIPIRVLVIGPRFSARGQLVGTLGVEVSQHPAGIGSQIAADPTGRTSDPGIWVAGNVTDVSAGIMQSTASGVLAAAAINSDLVQEDVAIAVETVRHQ